MHALKGKVSEKLSYLFADSPSSKYSSLDQSLASPHSKGGKYLSSFFSYIIPSASIDGLKSNKHNDDVEPIQSLPVGWIDKNFEWREEHLDSMDKSALACGSKETQGTHEEYEEPHSAKNSSDSDVFEEAIDSSSPERSMPNLTEDSAFISSNLYEFLQSSLPNIVKGRQWVLLYSTLKHGISLRTLIRKSADLPGPCLLIAGDMQGAVFGGLLECPLKPTAKRKYQGTNQTFVFTTIYGEPRLFRPTGVNRYFYLCLNDLLALGGGGHFALCLDEDLLSGSSGPCDTFGNLCLANSPDFQLKNVENTEQTKEQNKNRSKSRRRNETEDEKKQKNRRTDLVRGRSCSPFVAVHRSSSFANCRCRLRRNRRIEECFVVHSGMRREVR